MKIEKYKDYDYKQMVEEFKNDQYDEQQRKLLDPMWLQILTKEFIKYIESPVYVQNLVNHVDDKLMSVYTYIISLSVDARS